MLMLNITKIVLVFILITNLIPSTASKEIDEWLQTDNITELVQFPPILWTYLGGQLSQMPIFTQMCYNNFKHYAQISEWQLLTVKNTNIYDFISKENALKLNLIKQRKGKLTDANLADLYKIFVLYQNGGLWMDSSNILMRDLNWTNNIKEHLNLHNTTDQAQILVFTVGQATFAFDQKYKKQITVFPMIENSAIFAKPKAKILQDIISQLVQAHSYEEFYTHNEKKGLRYGIQKDQSYFYGAYQFSTAMQRIQKEMLQNKDEYKQYKQATDYYKLWSVNALTSSYALSQISMWLNDWILRDLHSQPIQYLQRLQMKAVFLKFTDEQISHLHKYLQRIANDKQNLCFGNISSFSNNSLMSQFLLKHSQHLELVKRLNFIKEGQMQCKIANESFLKIAKGISEWLSSVVMGTLWIFLAVFGLIRSQQQLKLYALRTTLANKQGQGVQI